MGYSHDRYRRAHFTIANAFPGWMGWTQIRKGTEQAKGSKPIYSIPPWLVSASVTAAGTYPELLLWHPLMMDWKH